MMQSKFTPLLDTGVVYSCDVARRSRGAMSDGHERGKRQEKKEGRVAKEVNVPNATLSSSEGRQFSKID